MRSSQTILAVCLLLLAGAAGMAAELPAIPPRDLYAFELPEASRVTLELTAADPWSEIDFFLMTSDGGNELRVVSASEPGQRTITTLLPRGTYYVGVSALGSSPYALTLSAPDLQGTAKIEIDGGPFAVNHPETLLEIAAEEVEINAVAGARRRATLHPPPCTYTLSATSQSVSSIAGTGTFGVTTRSDCGWTANTTTSWLTITSGKTGTGNGTIGYSFAANTSSSSRTGSITAGGKTLSVTQVAACTYTVSPTSKDFGSEGGSGTVTVTTRSDCPWTAAASTTAPWITITAGQSGTGNGTVAYSVAANTSTSSRSGSLTIGGRTVSISQSPDISSCTYTPAYTSKTISWCGGERTIQVTTQGDCPWTATSDATWLTIILANRSGTRSLSYTVAPNTTGSSRQATLTVGGKAVQITQNARSGNGTYDGNWTGTTNGGRAVSLCVAEGALQSVAITVRLEFPTFFCTTPLIRQQELALSGSSFSGTFTTFPEVSNISTTARGNFTSPSAMNGSWDSYSGSYLIICGSTIGFGTGGLILPSGTFTATKQP
jgi:hypothetical protein